MSDDIDRLIRLCKEQGRQELALKVVEWARANANKVQWTALKKLMRIVLAGEK